MNGYLDRLSRSMGYEDYNHYLSSEHWTNFVKEFKAKRCYCCRSEKELHLHHLTYERLGREIPQDVVTVCQGCHKLIHEKVKNGTKLESAHFAVSRKYQRKGTDKNWVHWKNLLNKSKKQTITQLQNFLTEVGLLGDGLRGTKKAFDLGYVVEIDGKERWNIKKYIRLMHSERKKSRKPKVEPS